MDIGQAQRRRSEPLGLARAAAFERLATVHARRDALNPNPSSQSTTHP